MDLAPLVPLTYYLMASLLTISSLRLRKRNRIMTLVPICLFSLLSLTSAHKLPHLRGANNNFTSMVVFYIPYWIKLLALDERPFSLESSSHSWTFADCYRIWNNPRNLPIRISFFDNLPPCDLRSRAIFAINQASEAAALYILNYLIFQTLLIDCFSYITTADFSPKMELPTPRLSTHNLQVRTFISLSWIWTAYFLNSFSHLLLSIIFVVIGFDRPEEWPPLYGPLLNATSICGFWGRFWHRLPIPMYTHYSKLISRSVLRLHPGSRADKTTIPLLIFAMSGVSHGVVAWAVGDAAPSRDVLFFFLSFLAAAGETMVEKAKALETTRRSWKQMPWFVRKVVGFAWVFAFFFCVAPMWLYPKIYQALVVRIKLRIHYAS